MELIRKSVQAMEGYVPGEQPTDTSITKLNTNENPYPPSPSVIAAIKEISADSLRKYPHPTAMKLRELIADIHGCAAENVFVGNGSDEVLALCTRAFVENDGTIGYFEPSYSLYPVLADIRDVATNPIELPADFTFDYPEGYDCSLFFMTNPNAPTGILYGLNDVKRFCEAVTGVVVVDEAYVDFSSATCEKLALEMDNVLIARTLSKSFSLAGIRMGYAVGAAPLIDAMYKLKDSYNTDVIAQNAAFAALSDLAGMMANVEKIKATRSRLTDELTDRGFYVYPSESNFLWVKPEGIAAADLFERLRERKVLIRYFTGARTADFVRITVGSEPEADILIEALDSIPGISGGNT